MKKLSLLLVAAACMLFAGCKTPLFNPKADAQLAYFTDMTNVQVASLTLSGTPPHSAKAFVRINNGIDVNFTGYSIDYYDINGKLLPVKISNTTTSYIAGSGSSISPATGYVTINVTDAAVTAYKTANALSQLNLVVVISGEDINGNQISINGNFTLY